MSWVSRFLTSSIGQKLIMSLTGLFLILFLVVHLAGNLQLLYDDGGVAFNVYAKFMTTNPVIKLSSYGLYAFILLHTIQGLMLWRMNRTARGGQGYAVKRTRAVGTSAALASRMGWLGVIILVFLILHLYQFWLQMKLGNLTMITVEGMEMKDLYSAVLEAYRNPVFVIIYVVSMAVVGMHLWHGFQSSFQSLGLNHRKYTPLIRGLGKLYSIVVPALFALIPVYMYLFR
jgi:succinate dehydrogenase / fumarate reductase, cytochrome b subunit